MKFFNEFFGFKKGLIPCRLTLFWYNKPVNISSFSGGLLKRHKSFHHVLYHCIFMLLCRLSLQRFLHFFFRVTTKIPLSTAAYFHLNANIKDSSPDCTLDLPSGTQSWLCLILWWYCFHCRVIILHVFPAGQNTFILENKAFIWYQ